IRILRLYPGKDRDLLKCTLSEIRTRSLPKYEALSYTWGPNEFPKRITDGDSGADIAITNNLFDAFQVLRLEEESRLLWIDAVCINQNDDVEKSGQVAMMSSIYQNADSVLVWLGSAPEDHLETTNSEPVFEKSHSALSDAITAGVGTIFESKWFTRVWIVQEYILAK
ncbi:HET-domain-containing protein, partial [Cadophora sp. DSE1049]